MSDPYMPQPGALQQPAAAASIRRPALDDPDKPALDDPDTISVSIRWRRSQPIYFWLEVNGKALGEYDPLQEWPRAELDLAGRSLRSTAKMYDVADAETAPKIPS
jgi:hypothetical protein